MTDLSPEQERILVVDDDPTLSAVLSRALRRRGFEVATAATADEALAVAGREGFQRAILDLKLAESSGLSLIPQLLDRQPQLQIVMLTGYSSIATAVEAIKLGAENYLCKPADADDILAAFPGASAAGAGANDADNDADDAIARARGFQHEEGPQPPSVNRLEWEHIQRVLHEHDGNISATARALGMHRRTLQRKLNKRPVRR